MRPPSSSWTRSIPSGRPGLSREAEATARYTNLIHVMEIGNYFQNASVINYVVNLYSGSKDNVGIA